MTFDALLEQKFKAELGVVLVTGTKSSLELKYGPLRDRKNRLQRCSLQEWKPFVPFYDRKNNIQFCNIYRVNWGTRTKHAPLVLL